MNMLISKRITQLQCSILPDELVEEILLRLPVKSICRFKCVSKSWRTLFSTTSQFVKKHHDFHIHDSDRVIFFNIDQRQYEYPYLVTTKNGNDGITRDVKIPHLDLKRNLSVAGSCHGFVLITQEHEYFYGILLNPITLEAIQIPKTGLPEFRMGQVGDWMYGLGYDSSKKDFKIMMIDYWTSFHFLYIYSLKTKSWRELGFYPYEHHRYSQGVHVDGCLHWVSRTRGENRSCIIAAFNLSTEKFENVPYPRGFECAEDLLNIHLIVLGGCLAMVIGADEFGTFRSSIGVWLMKEYGVQDSWTKITIHVPQFRSSLFQIACSLNENEVLLLKNSMKFVAYDWRNGTMRDIVLDRTLNHVSKTGITSFKETLLYISELQL